MATQNPSAYSTLGSLAKAINDYILAHPDAVDLPLEFCDGGGISEVTFSVYEDIDDVNYDPPKSNGWRASFSKW
jgi:hypothetical protein